MYADALVAAAIASAGLGALLLLVRRRWPGLTPIIIALFAVSGLFLVLAAFLVVMDSLQPVSLESFTGPSEADG